MNPDVQQMRAELQRSYRVHDMAAPAPGVILRERSFVRPQSHVAHHNQMREHNKRRSMILTNSRGKPTLEIYRPPGVRAEGPATASAPGTPQHSNKLNVHAKEFTMARPCDFRDSDYLLRDNGHGAEFDEPGFVCSRLASSCQSGRAMASYMRGRYSTSDVYEGGLQHSRSSAAVLHAGQALPQHYRPVQPLQPLPLLSSASSGNIVHVQQGGPRVHFKLPQQGALSPSADKKGLVYNGAGKVVRPQWFVAPALKRSKSLTSADALASGMAALGLAADAGDLGLFPPDIQQCIDRALEDPNAVSARTLMDAVGHLVGRAVESPRYALPAARRCIAVVERESTETFLESLLNTCQQWYHDRDKVLGAVVGGGRPRLMAFLSFLLEMYCQLRRRAIQRREPPAGAAAAAPPGRVLLTLICKCCEDCIRQPVPSPGDTENLFFVLTYIGRDLETQLPAELEKLLAAVRDAFLNTAAAPSIRKTLLQLIELHASRWQLPGCAVLYYYPSSK